jgi:hypothetical protein
MPENAGFDLLQTHIYTGTPETAEANVMSRAIGVRNQYCLNIA